jgi:hypothetical protein
LITVALPQQLSQTAMELKRLSRWLRLQMSSS